MFLSLLISIALTTYPLEPVPIPLLMRIAQCESATKQFDDETGEVLLGITKDIGYFQISPLWLEKAEKLGYDIYTEEGNIGMALWLFDRYGVHPWYSSKHCWLDNSSKQCMLYR